ncbi:MAG: type I-E CRISPR-associated protein Cas5/CasD [Eubacteriales bacterium]
MSTLLLRLAGPLQSWGLDKFERRGTSRMPTRSAVVGMAMAAMGMKRDQEIPQGLLNLRFGIRGDDEGVVIRDFHTVKQGKLDSITIESFERISDDNIALTYKRKINEGETSSYITNRYYLCDAVFLVGLEGDEEYLKQLEQAFLNPVFPLYLGRKSCPPEGRLVLGIRNLSLEQALKQEPWLLPIWRQEQQQRRNKNIRLRLVVDADGNEEGYFVEDMPVSFDNTHRKYSVRKVKDLPSLLVQRNLMLEHDAFATAKGGG